MDRDDYWFGRAFITITPVNSNGFKALLKGMGILAVLIMTAFVAQYLSAPDWVVDAVIVAAIVVAFVGYGFFLSKSRRFSVIRKDRYK